MGRSKPPTQSSAPGRKAAEQIKENSSRKINKFIKKQQEKSTNSTASKLNAMQMDPPGGRRRMGRSIKDPTPDSESSSSPVDADSSNDANTGYGGPECRRSSRKKTIKFDVRDLLNKNRKSHKIQIEARIDSNAPKVGAGQATKEELDSKQKTFIEKSAIFRRFSISENKLPPRPPPPPALIQTIQQCVGELEQLPLDGDIDFATITPIARRLSRTQEILTASMMKPKQVNSLIVTKLDSASTSRATVPVKGRVGRPRLSQPPVASTLTQQKRRGRPPKFKMVAESSDSTVDSSNDSFETSETTETSETNTQTTISSCNSDRSSPGEQSDVKREEDSASNGRQMSVSPDSSTKGIDLREMLDASAVTLPQPTILDDCMLVSTDDLFVAAEEEVFTEALSSDESTVTLRVSPKEKNVDEISLFARSDSTETNSSDDSERRRRKVRVSVKRVVLPSPIKERTESTQKYSSSEEKSGVIEIYSSNDDDSSTYPDVKYKQKTTVAAEVDISLKVESSSKPITTRASRKKQVESCMTPAINTVEGDNSNSTTSIVEISSDSATPIDELLAIDEITKSPNLRITRTRAKSCKRVEDGKVDESNLNCAIGSKSQPVTPAPLQLNNVCENVPEESDVSNKLTSPDAQETAIFSEQTQISGQVSLRKRRNAPQQGQPSPTICTVLLRDPKDKDQLNATNDAVAPPEQSVSSQISLRSRKDAKEKEILSQPPAIAPESSKTKIEKNESVVPKQNVANTIVSSKNTQEVRVVPDQSQQDDQNPGQNKGDNLEKSIPAQERQTNAHVTLRIRNHPIEKAERSPTSKTRNDTQDQNVLALQNQAVRSSDRKVGPIPTTKKIISESGGISESLTPETDAERYSNDTPSHGGEQSCVQIEQTVTQTTRALSKQNEQTAEIQSSVEPEITKNEAASFFTKTTEESTQQVKTNMVLISGRRESLRAGIRASESLLKKVTSKKTSKTPAKMFTTDQTSTSSDSSECQDSTPKNRRQAKTSLVHKPIEETSNMCSESSLIMSYLSSSSSSSLSSSSSTSSTSSSSTSASSSSQLRATRSRKAQQTTQEKNLETELEPSISPRVTPPRKVKSDSHNKEAKTPASAITKKSRKLEEQFTEPDSEGSENAETKTPITTIAKISRKSEEQYTEPDSESSENSAKHRSQTSTIEKDCDIRFKERAKLTQRRKSARLNRWVSTLEKEANETGSESSETSPRICRTRANRSKGSAEVAVKAQHVQSPSTASYQVSLSETSIKTSDETLVKNEFEARTEKSFSLEGKYSDKKGETVSKIKELQKSPLKLEQSVVVEKPSELTSTSTKIPLQKEKVGETSTTEEETKMSPKEVFSPRSKSKKRIKKFVALKNSSSESNTLSDNETSVGGTLSRTHLRNTRARRKTISNEIELQELFTTNLSPPDKAIEYSSPKSRKSSDDRKLLESTTAEQKNTSQLKKEVDYKQEAPNNEIIEIDSSSGMSEDLKNKPILTPETSEVKANELMENLKDLKTQIFHKEVDTTVSGTLELEGTPLKSSAASTSADVLKPELVKISRQKKGTRFSPANPDNLQNIEKATVESLALKTNLDVAATELVKISKPNEGSVSTSEAPDVLVSEGSAKISCQKRKTTNTANDPDISTSLENIKTQSPPSNHAANEKEVDVSKIVNKLKDYGKPIYSCISTQVTVEKDALVPAPSTKSTQEITRKYVQMSVKSKSSSLSTGKSESVTEEEACTDTINHVTLEKNIVKPNPSSTSNIKTTEDVQKSLESDSDHISDDCSKVIAEKVIDHSVECSSVIESDSTVKKNVVQLNCTPNVMSCTDLAAEEDLQKVQSSSGSSSTPKAEESSDNDVKKEMDSLLNTKTLQLDAKQLINTAKVISAMQEEDEVPTIATEQNVQAVCLEKSQHKKQHSPRTKKKSVTQHQQNAKSSEEIRTPKSVKDTDVTQSKELDLKSISSESNHSDDSLKVEAHKTEPKLTPRRQLDSSFIESLEKSLLRPITGKRSSKKKEKEPNLTPSPKGKEETKKSKKVQETQEQKKLDTCSPKPKKKQKDTPKIDKKLDEDTSTKRKSLTKVKEPEVVKPLEPDPPKNEIKNSFDASNDRTPVEIAYIEPSEVQETPDDAPKNLKSKGETKFYGGENLSQPIQSQPLTILDPACALAVEKEKSPDLLPDPLKDIEKFIEDGVNLLKRGYKLGDDEEAAMDRSILKSDDLMTPKKCKLDDSNEEKKESPTEDDNSNSNSECSTLATTPTTDIDTPNGIRRSHRIKNNSKSTKCLVGRGLVRDKERFSMKDDEKTIYSIDDQKMDLAEVEAKNSQFLKDMEERLSNFRVIRENEYKCERVISKEARRMLCDCFLTPEEEERGELGCGEDCLNRLLMIECGSDCTVRDRCTNRRFTKFLYSPCRVFRTEKKGFGIMADIEILPGEFIMEYVGEVINGDEFEFRRNAYSQEKNKHYYFMALRSDAIIDATAKGNISRFINHSCDPNAETQKWTVNGELRIGFFSRKSIMPGEEITFDYQYQRYGKEAQKCYCESSNCRGWIGEEPSSEEEEEEELDGYEEGESEETEEEEGEDQQIVPLPTIPTPVSPLIRDDQFIPVVSTVPEVPALDKVTDVLAGMKVVSPVPIPTPIAVETPVDTSNEVLAKKKKEKKRIDRKEEKIKRRETKQYLEDPDIEDEVRFLVKCGLKNQADTLRLSRLIVRAKLLGTRLKLLQILRKGELPCRRLFLDYHGLRLLHGWMSEVIDTRDTDKSMEIRMVLLSVLECLPISNKTMLTDSKVYQTVRDWSNNKESHSPSDESPKDTNTCTAGSEDSSSELQKLATKLVNTWDNLPEVFRIPKRERIEQMKEHEREADRQYKGLGDDVSRSEVNRNRERFMRINGPKSSRFKWSRGDKDKDRERATERRKYTQNGGSCKDGNEKTTCTLPGDSHLSKEQRRELFAAKVARDEAEKRLAEERREFDIKCRFFGLDPKRMRPENMPFCVNPSTGQWYSTDEKPILTPPSYAHVQVPVKPKSTNPDDYRLPAMDLPPLWKFAISPKGKIYYYHVKIRIPQWEPPIKILPLAGQNNVPLKNSESDSSNADCIDSSEDDIEVIKGLDPVKLQAYIEKKIEDRRLQRYTRLVEEKPISPRKEEDRIYNQMEVRKYKENKEKIRKRKEEIRRKRDSIVKGTPIDSSEAAENDADAVDAIPIQDYLLSSDEEDIKAECDNSPLIDKIVQGDKIVDELDALQSKRPLKRPLLIREKHEHKKRKLDKGRDSNKSTKRSKDGENSGSSKYRKIREKFRCEIAGIIVQHLKPYRKETCFSGRILTDDDFNHLARKLTHFVMVKELKYCESIGQTLVVTESVKNKSREFIKKYMAKYGEVYVRPKNDPEFKEIPFL